MSFSHPAHLSSVVDIPIHCPIVTAQTVSSMVAAVLDLLLFERKQIPLVYQTFKFMVEKFTAEKPGSGHGGGDSGDWDDYLVERVRNDAVQTLNSIKAMKRSIAEHIDKNTIDRVMILFGPDGLMPSEAYNIHLPAVNPQHFGGNHSKEDMAVVRQVSMSVLSAFNNLSEATTQRHWTNGTRVFAMLHTPVADADNTTTHRAHVVHHNYELHPDCQLTTFRLLNTATVATANNCCRDLIVFRDMGALQVDEAPLSGDRSPADEADNAIVEDKAMWLEYETYVSGFKDKLINGKSIWI